MIAQLLLASCSWNAPGVHPYTGDPVAALNSYALTAEQHAELRTKMRDRRYDDLVEIRQDSIQGKAADYDDMRNMHFGKNTLCQQIKREAWGPRVERGMVYCSGEACVVVPSVCNNVSQVSRVERGFRPLPRTAGGPGGPGGFGMSFDTALLPALGPGTPGVVLPSTIPEPLPALPWAPLDPSGVPVLTYATAFGTSSFYLPPNPSPVPDAPRGALMLIGLAALGAWMLRPLRTARAIGHWPLAIGHWPLAISNN